MKSENTTRPRRAITTVKTDLDPDYGAPLDRLTVSLCYRRGR